MKWSLQDFCPLSTKELHNGEKEIEIVKKFEPDYDGDHT